MLDERSITNWDLWQKMSDFQQDVKDDIAASRGDTQTLTALFNKHVEDDGKIQRHLFDGQAANNAAITRLEQAGARAAGATATKVSLGAAAIALIGAVGGIIGSFLHGASRP